MPTDFTKEDIQRNFDEYLQKRYEEGIDKTVTVKKIEVVTYNEGKPFYLDEK